MHKLTVDLPDAAWAGLQRAAHKYNGDLGVNLSVDEYVDLHLRELSIADQLAERLPAINEEIQVEHGRRVTAAREVLLRDQ